MPISEQTLQGHANELMAAIHTLFPSLLPAMIRVESLTCVCMVDVVLPAYQARNEWVNVVVHESIYTTESTHINRITYGFSIVDNEAGYGDGADCIFGDIPTLLKYMKRLFPLQDASG